MNRIRTGLLVAAVVLLAAAPLALAGGEEEASGAGASTIPAGYFGTYEPAIDMEWIKSTWQSARERGQQQARTGHRGDLRGQPLDAGDARRTGHQRDLQVGGRTARRRRRS